MRALIECRRMKERLIVRLAGERRRTIIAVSVASLLIVFTAFIHVDGAPRLDVERLAKTGQISAPALFFLLAAATLVSEDATCVTAGLLVAGGHMSFALAVGGSLFGIFFGDVLLFLIGRYLGRRALRLSPFKWLISEEAVRRSSVWFARRGPTVILLSRFIPGTRLPTYFAAGLLETGFRKFSFYLLLAAGVWTPLVVGLAATLGMSAGGLSLLWGRSAQVRLLIAGVALYVTVKFMLYLASFRGRRLLVSRLRRLTRWEFWPPYVFYLPVIAYCLLLGIKHRSLTLFTCANPCIPAGGFIGESKMAILRALSSSRGAHANVAQAVNLDSHLTASARLQAAHLFMKERGVGFPLVVKPDAGQRGQGVRVVRNSDELEEAVNTTDDELLVQEYAPGYEFGVFYYRRPCEERGHIFSITEKRFPTVEGDGESRLEELILNDGRAVCMAKHYFKQHAGRLCEVPARGEILTLVEIGSHCHGALFLDGSRFGTAALERAIDRLSRGFQGFHFGRFDIRTPSLEDFKRGRNFKVVELNGVTSEATHIYDPAHGLLNAYKVLFKQWRLAFEIGAENRALGARPSTLKELFILTYRNLFSARLRTRCAGREYPGRSADITRGGGKLWSFLKG